MAIAQIPIEQIFGAGVVFDDTEGFLKISLADLATVGLNDPEAFKPLEILGAICKLAATRLIPETNEGVLGQAELSVLAPFNRDGIDRTLFTYTFGFFRDYASPDFDPNEPTV